MKLESFSFSKLKTINLKKPECVNFGSYLGNIKLKTLSSDKVSFTQDKQSLNPVAQNTSLTMCVSDSNFNITNLNTPNHKDVKIFAYPQDPMITKPEMINVSVSLPNNFGETRFNVDNYDKIIDFTEGDNFKYDIKSPEFDQTNVLAYSYKTLSMYEKILGRKVNWYFSKPTLSLGINKENSNKIIYKRAKKSIEFPFIKMTDDSDKVFKSCCSPDLICHEVGHAVLDGLKRDRETFTIDGGAFSESFADVSAILVALFNDKLTEKVLTYTKGDLKKPNMVAFIAEEYGYVLSKLGKFGYDITGKQEDIIEQEAAIEQQNSKNSNHKLRSAINSFKSVPYRELPYQDTVNHDAILGLETHNYSRLYTGTIYEILTSLYESKKGSSNDLETQKKALAGARDILAVDFARSVDFSPGGLVNFKDMAIGLIKADIFNHNGTNRKIIEKVFLDRNILKPEDITQMDEELQNLPKLELPKDVITKDDAKVFLDNNKKLLNIPKDIDFTPSIAYINDKDEKHMVFVYPKEIELKGEEYGSLSNGKIIVLNGSVCLTFDKNNQLMDKTVRLVTKNDIEDLLFYRQLLAKEYPYSY